MATFDDLAARRREVGYGDAAPQRDVAVAGNAVSLSSVATSGKIKF